MKAIEKVHYIAFRVVQISMILCAVWLAVSTTLQRYKCPSMTETELFFAIPKIFTADYKECR